VLKLNGKTEIPPDKAPISPCVATVEDAVHLGADAVGYTLYVGSPLQAEDFAQFRTVREDAERYGMPIIAWSYPRGEAIEAKGGRDSLYAVDYAARVACELGADIVKLTLRTVSSPTGSQANRLVG
jgi:class I fructose-bisphosphate aldolase